MRLSSRSRSTIRNLSLLLGSLAILIGCQPVAPSQSSAGGSEPAAPAAPAAPKVVRIDNRKENTAGISIFATNNASQRETTWTFHAGLTAYDAQGNLVGRLAAKVPTVQDGDWKVNADGTMDVTWKLKPNLTWHDGHALVAEDVALGYAMYLDKDIPTQRTGGVDLVSNVTVVDPLTAVVHWKQLYFNANISDLTDVSPVPSHIIGDVYKGGDRKALANAPYWTNQFIGLGPYKLTNWVGGSFMEGQAFDKYVLGKPKIDKVLIQISYDPNVSLAGLLSGDIDIIPQALSSQDRDPVLGKSELSLIQWPTSTTGAIWQWRDAAAPWVGDDRNTNALKVRTALLQLIDRQQMADSFSPGGGGVANLFLTPTDPVFKLVEAKGYAKFPYDPNKAAQLLQETGWTKGSDGMLKNAAGQGFPFEVRDNAPETGDTLTFIDNLKKGGVAAFLYTIPANAVDRGKQRAESQGVRIGGAAISDEMMIQFTTKEVRAESNNWSGLNQGGYTNSVVDANYGKFLIEFDVNKRNAIYADFHKYIVDQLLRIPWYYGSSAIAFKKSLVGPATLPPSTAVQAWNIHEWDVK